PAAEKKAQYYLDHDEFLTTTPITAAELFEGAYSSKRKKEPERVRNLLEHLELLELSLDVSESYGRIFNMLAVKGEPIGDLDTLIASTALTNRQILVTKNKAHFEKIPA
ncbi:MAG TPA: type II toxin-antitoxin system VapC family toxin, partial [Candidatus Bathyarchaeia archaeon]|nr:type II toxin-antitoxin system VapC family toxin [Candidatus Bathyarchaeia archaeon]